MNCLRHLTVLLTVVLYSAQAVHAEDRASDRAAIRAVIEKRTDGFNKQDAASQAALFTTEADFYASNGTVYASGRKNIENVLAYVHKNALKDSTLEQKVTRVSFLTPDIAQVTIDLKMTRPKEAGGIYRNRGLRIMVRQDGAWRIRTFINQRVVASTTSQKDIEKAFDGSSK